MLIMADRWPNGGPPQQDRLPFNLARGIPARVARVQLHMVKVLILEDEALISMTLQDVLADHGFQPTVARSLSDALQIIRTQSFDAAILNWRIGEETAEHLIHELEMTATAIVVLTTGGADALKARLAKHSVLDKPHILNDIVAEIKRLLAE